MKNEKKEEQGIFFLSFRKKMQSGVSNDVGWVSLPSKKDIFFFFFFLLFFLILKNNQDEFPS
jgi:hypothetical protein